MCLALLELFGGIFCLSCHTAIGLGLLQVHRFSLRMVQFTATDVTSNPTPQGLLRRRTHRPQCHHVQHVRVEPSCRFRPSQRPKICFRIPSRPRTRTPALPPACRFPGVGRKVFNATHRSPSTLRQCLVPWNKSVGEILYHCLSAESEWTCDTPNH